MSNHPRTVLLVDDFVGIREMLRGAFESAGFSVCTEAKDGAEAIKAAMKHKPDLIVLDQSMPVMNGLEAALSNAYYPPEERGLSQTAINFGTQMESAVLNHVFQEFWPDIRTKVCRRK